MNMIEIHPGDTFRHKRTGNIYVVEGELSLKQNGEEWIKIIVYARDGLSYARLPEDFMANFDLVERF